MFHTEGAKNDGVSQVKDVLFTAILRVPFNPKRHIFYKILNIKWHSWQEEYQNINKE